MAARATHLTPSGDGVGGWLFVVEGAAGAVVPHIEGFAKKRALKRLPKRRGKGASGVSQLASGSCGPSASPSEGWGPLIARPS